MISFSVYNIPLYLTSVRFKRQVFIYFSKLISLPSDTGFCSGEVGYEEAHRNWKRACRQGFRGEYSYVVTTHIDKGIYTIISSFVRLTTLNITNTMTAHRPTTASAT